MGIEIVFTDAVKRFLAQKGFDRAYGARPLRRAVVRYVEDPFSVEMLKQRVKSGDHVTCDTENDAVIFRK